MRRVLFTLSEERENWDPTTTLDESSRIRSRILKPPEFVSWVLWKIRTGQRRDFDDRKKLYYTSLFPTRLSVMVDCLYTLQKSLLDWANWDLHTKDPLWSYNCSNREYKCLNGQVSWHSIMHWQQTFTGVKFLYIIHYCLCTILKT